MKQFGEDGEFKKSLPMCLSTNNFKGDHNERRKKLLALQHKNMIGEESREKAIENGNFITGLLIDDLDDSSYTKSAIVKRNIVDIHFKDLVLTKNILPMLITVILKMEGEEEKAVAIEAKKDDTILEIKNKAI